MNIYKHAINGSSDDDCSTLSLKALSEFYYAFNNQDISVMKSNWLDAEDISLANPLGGLYRGWQEIESLYANLFNGPANVSVEYYDYSIYESGNLFQAVGRERGCFCINDVEIDLAIRTSRTYVQTPRGWKQYHHHGSIDNADLLKQYQQAVFDNL